MLAVVDRRPVLYDTVGVVLIWLVSLDAVP